MLCTVVYGVRNDPGLLKNQSTPTCLSSLQQLHLGTAATAHERHHRIRQTEARTQVRVVTRTTYFSISCSRHARVAHSKHKVLPVPVGLSSRAFDPETRRDIEHRKEALRCGSRYTWICLCIWCKPETTCDAVEYQFAALGSRVPCKLFDIRTRCTGI